MIGLQVRAKSTATKLCIHRCVFSWRLHLTDNERNIIGTEGEQKRLSHGCDRLLQCNCLSSSQGQYITLSGSVSGSGSFVTVVIVTDLFISYTLCAIVYDCFFSIFFSHCVVSYSIEINIFISICGTYGWGRQEKEKRIRDIGRADSCHEGTWERLGSLEQLSPLAHVTALHGGES